MNKMLSALALSAAVVGVSATAQMPVAAIAPATGAVLRSGTSVPMKIREGLTTKGKLLKVGQRVQMEVAEDVILNGQVVIPAGTPGVGELTVVRNKGMFGKSGFLQGKAVWIRVGDRQIRMSGVFDDKGVAGGVGAGVATYATLVGGFFVTGTSAQIPTGTPVPAFLDEDVPVVMAAVAPPAVQAVTPAPVAEPAKVVPAALTTASR